MRKWENEKMRKWENEKMRKNKVCTKLSAYNWISKNWKKLEKFKFKENEKMRKWENEKMRKWEKIIFIKLEKK
jgi:hypothetical protein